MCGECFAVEVLQLLLRNPRKLEMTIRNLFYVTLSETRTRPCLEHVRIDLSVYQVSDPEVLSNSPSLNLNGRGTQGGGRVGGGGHSQELKTAFLCTKQYQDMRRVIAPQK